MAYRYKKNQIFAKKLDVPKYVQDSVYNNTLSLVDYIKYDLHGKIPDTCLGSLSRSALRNVGYEKLRLVEDKLFYLGALHNVPSVLELLSKYDGSLDINEYLYRELGDKLYLSSYTPGMREYYKDRFFSEEEIDKAINDYQVSIMYQFNNGKCSIMDIFDNWELFKYKDLDYVLIHNNYYDDYNFNTKDVHEFYDKYGTLFSLIRDRVDTFAFMSKVLDKSKSEEEVSEYISKFVKSVMDYSKNYHTELTNEEYREIFKYIDLGTHLEDISYRAPLLMKELEGLEKDYFFNTHFPVSLLLKRDVLYVISLFGFKNIVEFDLECGGLFSKNNYAFLINFYEFYLHYGNNIHDLEKKYDVRKKWDEQFTKYEFYESLRRLLKYGPSNGEYMDKCPNFSDITGEFKNTFPELFISDEAPKELQDLFYTKSLTPSVISEHPEYKEFIRGKDLFASFVTRYIRDKDYKLINLYEYLNDTFGFDNMMDFISEYHNIIELVNSSEVIFNDYNGDYFVDSTSDKFTFDDFKKIFDKAFIHAIESKLYNVPKDVPDRIRVLYPNAFLDDSVPSDIQDAYYSRGIDSEFIKSHPDILNYFGNTNICYGLSKDLAWLIRVRLIGGVKKNNEDRLKILEFYDKIDDNSLQTVFINFVENNLDAAINRLEVVYELLKRISYSNSKEVFNFRDELARQLLEVEHPVESLERVEKFFEKSTIPTYLKLYGVFDILHPGFMGFNMGSDSKVSPVLKNSSINERENIIKRDLLKSALLSNNRSLLNFLDLIEFGDALFEDDSITLEDEYMALKYRDTLISIIELNNNSFSISDNIFDDLRRIREEYFSNGIVSEQIVALLTGDMGFKSVGELKSYIEENIKKRDLANRERVLSYNGLKIAKGDLIKGIGNIRYVKNILQNGSVSKEYLGASSTSDSTPLDTDLSMVTLDLYGNKENIGEAGAGSYGDIYFVLKASEDRFNVTRDVDTEEVSKDDRLELFYTGVIDTRNSKHYGIRTGFASSEVDFIVVSEANPALFLEIAMNGFYIPVVDMNDRLVFSPKDYDNLRTKMSGISYYKTGNFIFSDNLEVPGIEGILNEVSKNEVEVKYKRDKILGIIKSALDECGLSLKTTIDGDLSKGSVELLDTGSTGRGTNRYGDGDFDFMMRIDRNILSDASQMSKLRDALSSKFNVNGGVIATGDFRLKDVVIDDIIVDIDISFTSKTNEISYSTDMCLQDRLNLIKMSDPEKYNLVIANILLAKKVLKEAGCYKPNRGEVPQGGLGGVGIENWILQHGGSFIDACESFLRTAETNDFEEFKKGYCVYDFGENLLAERRGAYVHDNFVDNNMSREGYLKMRDALNEFLYEVRYNNNKTSSLN